MIYAVVTLGFLVACLIAATAGQRMRINVLEERIVALEKKTKDLVAE